MKFSTFAPSVIGVVGALADAKGATFTPKDLLGSIRPGPITPSKNGTFGLCSATQYDFEKHVTKRYLGLGYLNDKSKPFLHIIEGEEKAFSDAQWAGDEDHVVFLKAEDDKSELWAVNIAVNLKPYKVATFPGEVANLKTRYVDGKFQFIVSAKAFPDGSIYIKDKAPKKHSTGRVYTSLFVRHWDEYVSEYKTNLFTSVLTLEDKKLKLSSDGLTNILKGTKLESPIGPFGGSGDYDISQNGKEVIFIAKDPELDYATNTASYVYIINFDGTGPMMQMNKDGGASNSPTWSPDNKQVLFLQMKQNAYEADKNSVYAVTYSEEKGFNITQLVPDWDRSPQSIKFSPDGKKIYFTAEEHGREKLWILKSQEDREPVAITNDFSVSSVHPIADTGKLLLSQSTLTNPSYGSILNPDGDIENLWGVDIGSRFGLSHHSQISDFWFKGTDDFKVHGFVIKPSFFDSKKKYPLVFFVHGGPQGAWMDGWSYRWNPVVFAEQGYVVVAINPTGSTGYGQEFTDRIQYQWGGRPYEDLVLGFEYIEKKFDFIDTENAIAAGASYGGYMMNWIAGMPLRKKFKALVCHDGIFNMENMYSTEELWFINHDIGKDTWDDPEAWSKWNPLRKADNWDTPMMIIHSSKDYRIPISEGLTPFNVLQIKGIKSKFLTFPDENHWVLKPENSLVWHKEVLEWMSEFTGVRVKLEEVVETEGIPVKEPEFVDDGGLKVQPDLSH